MAEDVMKKLHRIAREDRAKAKKAATTTNKPSGKTASAGSGSSAESTTDQSSGFSDSHDCGPWIGAPASSRVSEYRYDYGNGQLQVVWTNSRGFHGNKTIYQLDENPTGKSSSAVYRSFAQAVSKGKYVNNVLNDIKFWPGDDASFSAPSNPNRGTVKHKL